MTTVLQYNKKWGGSPGTPTHTNAAWITNNIVTLELDWDMVLYTKGGAPVHKIQVNKLALPKFKQAFSNVWNAAQTNAKLHKGMTTRQILQSFGGDIFSGAFNIRYVRGYEAEQVLSPHSWGIAVDLDASHNPMGAPLCTSFPSWYITAWKSADFIWGGDFTNRPDPMHMEVIT